MTTLEQLKNQLLAVDRILKNKNMWYKMYFKEILCKSIK
jgi:hypothetical protein